MSDIELLLIVADLGYLNKLTSRKNGFFGSVGGDLVHEKPPRRTVKRIWSEEMEQEVMDYYFEHGTIDKEGYIRFAVKYGKTVKQVRDKISGLRKVGKLPKISA